MKKRSDTLLILLALLIASLFMMWVIWEAGLYLF